MSFGAEMRDFIGAFQAGTQVMNVNADTKLKKWKIGDYGDDGPMPPSSFDADGNPLGETDAPQVKGKPQKSKYNVKPGEIESYIRTSAAKFNIDGDIAVRVAKSEGGVDDPVRQSGVVKDGKREESYGPFQLYLGGGLGNKALEAGIDPRDPKQWKQAVDFALENAAKSGWGQWYGAAKAGIGDWTGIGGPHRKPSSMPSTKTPSVTYDDPVPTSSAVPDEEEPETEDDTGTAMAGDEEEEEDEVDMAAENPEFTVAVVEDPELTNVAVVEEEPYVYAAKGGAIPDDTQYFAGGGTVDKYNPSRGYTQAIPEPTAASAAPRIKVPTSGGSGSEPEWRSWDETGSPAQNRLKQGRADLETQRAADKAAADKAAADKAAADAAAAAKTSSSQSSRVTKEEQSRINQQLYDDYNYIHESADDDSQASGSFGGSDSWGGMRDVNTGGLWKKGGMVKTFAKGGAVKKPAGKSLSFEERIKRYSRNGADPQDARDRAAREMNRAAGNPPSTAWPRPGAIPDDDKPRPKTAKKQKPKSTTKPQKRKQKKAPPKVVAKPKIPEPDPGRQTNPIPINPKSKGKAPAVPDAKPRPGEPALKELPTTPSKKDIPSAGGPKFEGPIQPQDKNAPWILQQSPPTKAPPPPEDRSHLMPDISGPRMPPKAPPGRDKGPAARPDHSEGPGYAEGPLTRKFKPAPKEEAPPKSAVPNKRVEPATTPSRPAPRREGPPSYERGSPASNPAPRRAEPRREGPPSYERGSPASNPAPRRAPDVVRSPSPEGPGSPPERRQSSEMFDWMKAGAELGAEAAVKAVKSSDFNPFGGTKRTPAPEEPGAGAYGGISGFGNRPAPQVQSAQPDTGADWQARDEADKARRQYEGTGWLGYAQGGAIPDEESLPPKSEAEGAAPAPSATAAGGAEGNVLLSETPPESDVDTKEVMRRARGPVQLIKSGVQRIFGIGGQQGGVPTEEGTAAQNAGIQRFARDEGYTTPDELQAIDGTTGIDKLRADAGMKNLTRIDQVVHWHLQHGNRDMAEAAAVSLALYGAREVKRAGLMAQTAYKDWQATGDPQAFRHFSIAVQKIHQMIPDGLNAKLDVDPKTRQLVATTVDADGKTQKHVIDPAQVPGMLKSAMDGSAYWNAINALGNPEIAGRQYTARANAEAKQEERAYNKQEEQFRWERNQGAALDKEGRALQGKLYERYLDDVGGRTGNERQEIADNDYFADLAARAQEAQTSEDKQALIDEGLGYGYEHTPDRSEALADEDIATAINADEYADGRFEDADKASLLDIARSLGVKNKEMNEASAAAYAAMLVTEPIDFTDQGTLFVRGGDLVFNPMLLPLLRSLREKYREQ